MNRLSRIASLAKAGVWNYRGCVAEANQETGGVALAGLKNWYGFATAPTTSDDVGLATGLEKQELEAMAKGIDPWHESWLDAPWGTEENPVEVPSTFAERIVGVPDPDDDSLVWWGLIEDGQPPKQVIEGGEFFVLKKLPGQASHH